VSVNEPVSVHILDREYTVGVEASERSSLMAAAKLLDSKMREVRGSNRMAAVDRVAVLARRHVPWETDVTIACGGAAVQPGDVIVGDGDGVIVIPPALVEEVLAEAETQEREDAWVAEQVAAGASVDGLFPMNAEWRVRYEAALRLAQGPTS